MGILWPKFKNRTMKKIVILSLIMISTFITNAQDISGKWNGKVKAGNNEIQFVFSIEKIEEGYSASMAIPARNITSLKAKSATYENGNLFIDGSNSGWAYKGTFDNDEGIFKGSFKEGVNELPLHLTKGDAQPDKRTKRPQEPGLPYPYNSEEVVFDNVGAGIQLAGTLTKPKGLDKAPVAILITGSGPQNRDEEIYGHKPFLVLADFLTRQGIAVLRYDDRGVNESTGNFAESTTADFATDVMAALDYLKTRSDIDHDRIGLIGHSEGGIIAPMVAVKRPKDISFLISLAGTGVSGYETARLQTLHMAKGKVPDIQAYDDFIRRVLDAASKKGDLETVRKTLAQVYLSSEFFNGAIPPNADKEAILESLVLQRTTIWSRYFYTYNPADMFEKVTCPVLSINGDKDTQVFAKVNQNGIREALENSENADFTVTTLSGLNHFFQKAETGEMSEYASIETTIEPEVLEMIASWVLERMQ